MKRRRRRTRRRKKKKEEKEEEEEEEESCEVAGFRRNIVHIRRIAQICSYILAFSTYCV
jgi:hypothetical protein